MGSEQTSDVFPTTEMPNLWIMDRPAYAYIAQCFRRVYSTHGDRDPRNSCQSGSDCRHLNKYRLSSDIHIRTFVDFIRRSDVVTEAQSNWVASRKGMNILCRYLLTND